jgi:hypothetical protein
VFLIKKVEDNSFMTINNVPVINNEVNKKNKAEERYCDCSTKGLSLGNTNIASAIQKDITPEISVAYIIIKSVVPYSLTDNQRVYKGSINIPTNLDPAFPKNT